MPLYNKLKEYRALIGVNQTRMGELVGVSRQTISQIERGDYSPSVTLALKIAKICNARVEDIFSYEEDREDEDEDNKAHQDDKNDRKQGSPEKQETRESQEKQGSPMSK